MRTAYHQQADGKTERTEQVLEGYLRRFVNYDQKDCYQRLPVAKYAYNNTQATAHKLTLVFNNYGSHPQMEWKKEREAKKQRATRYMHWMKKRQERAVTTLEQSPGGHEEILRSESNTTTRY